MANLTYPLMRSLPQVVFTAAFLKYPTPAVVCSSILSAALELCSSVLPSNLVTRELDFSIALSLDFLTSDIAEGTYNAPLVPETKQRNIWTQDQDHSLLEGVRAYGSSKKWSEISSDF